MTRLRLALTAAALAVFGVTTGAQARTVELLRRLADTAGAPGFEEPIRKVMVDEMRPFASSITFDGVLERFPGLRISVAELGAVWVPGFLQHLDQSMRAFRRLQDLSHLTMAPSAYIERQVRFTPFAGEPVGWMMGASSPELYCFSSDYPHHEGSDDPIRRFDDSMTDVSDADRDAFYRGNLAALLGARHAVHGAE